jgi:hypothetical protein
MSLSKTWNFLAREVKDATKMYFETLTPRFWKSSVSKTKVGLEKVMLKLDR